MKERLCGIALIFLLSIQCAIYISYNKKNSAEKIEIPAIMINNKKDKTFSEFFQDINNIKKCSVKNINNNNNSYTANLTIKGSKEDIISGLDSLNEYNINSYKLSVIGSDISATLDIVYKL